MLWLQLDLHEQRLSILLGRYKFQDLLPSRYVFEDREARPCLLRLVLDLPLEPNTLARIGVQRILTMALLQDGAHGLLEHHFRILLCNAHGDIRVNHDRALQHGRLSRKLTEVDTLLQLLALLLLIEYILGFGVSIRGHVNRLVDALVDLDAGLGRELLHLLLDVSFCHFAHRLGDDLFEGGLLSFTA